MEHETTNELLCCGGKAQQIPFCGARLENAKIFPNSWMFRVLPPSAFSFIYDSPFVSLIPYNLNWQTDTLPHHQWSGGYFTLQPPLHHQFIHWGEEEEVGAEEV